MERMEIRASLMSHDRFDELLAVIDVTSDTGEPWGEREIRRTITGKIVEEGPLWHDYFEMWERIGHRFEASGKDYLTVNLLEVGEVKTVGWSGVNVDKEEMTVILVDFLDGTVEDYYKSRAAMLKRFEGRRKKMENARTPNDLRDLMGLSRLNMPHLNQPLPAAKLEEMKRVLRRQG